MRHLLLRHDALDAEGFAAQLAGTPGEVAQAILGAAREGLTEAQALLGMSFLNRVRWREEQGMLLIEAKH